MRACDKPSVNDCCYLTKQQLEGKTQKRCSLDESLICSLSPLKTQSQEPTAGSATMEKKAATS